MQLIQGILLWYCILSASTSKKCICTSLSCKICLLCHTIHFIGLFHIFPVSIVSWTFIKYLVVLYECCKRFERWLQYSWKMAFVNIKYNSTFYLILWKHFGFNHLYRWFPNKSRNLCIHFSILCFSSLPSKKKKSSKKIISNP